MKKLIVIAIVALALAVPAAFSANTYTWRVVKSKSVSGEFAATGVSATIRHPRGIAVRFIGRGIRGTAAWGCSKGVSISSWHRTYGRGLHILGHVSGKDSCDVVASIAGRGRVTVQILKLR
jgi:hypothetical protein